MEFLATLPLAHAAIKIGQDGATVQLEIPESELPKMVPLLLCRGKVLKVTIEPEEAKRSSLIEHEEVEL